MAKDESNRADSDTISREALGSIGRLGDLYDAKTDKFCGISVFREQLPPDSSAVSCTDNHHSEISVTVTNSLKEKLKILNIKGDLKLSILAGLVNLHGSGKYLNEKKTSFKSVECAMVCNNTTVVEHLDLFNDEVKNRISDEALRHPRATHVVVQIYWGAQCTVRVTDQNSEDKKKKEVEGSLKAQVEKLKMIGGSANVGAEAGFTREEKENWSKFSLEIFGDVLSDMSGRIPTTVDGAIEMIRDVPSLIQKSNNGKGKPLTYVMFPLSEDLRKYFNVTHLINQPAGQVHERLIVGVIQTFDHLSELTQKARDQLDEINDYSVYFTASELKEARAMLATLEVQEAGISSDLRSRLEAVRSGNSDDESLTALIKENHTTADETFQKFEKIYNAILPQIQFGKRCKKYGATYFTPPETEQIASAIDDYENVYVLFDGEQDCEKTQINHSRFIEIARNNQNDSTTAFCVTLSQQGEDARISHYRKGKLLCADVAKELETKNIAECMVAAKQAVYLKPFKASCPGSFDGNCSREERSWICLKCSETLQLCPVDSSLYCSCGKAKKNRFRFQCRDEAHGSHFSPYRDEARPSSSEGAEAMTRNIGPQRRAPPTIKGD